MARNRKENRLRRTDAITAYTFLRVVFGVIFFNHGFTRIGNIPGFAESMVQMYQDTFVPAALVKVPAYLIRPLAKVINGVRKVG